MVYFVLIRHLFPSFTLVLRRNCEKIQGLIETNTK
uniref:Uncharacterized protein n=1 Tax=Anopheles minimus TaxID=112268 RepID=A0A182WNU4_9DIPT